MSKFDLKTIIETLIAFRRERNWEKFHLPRELVSALSIETSELEELFLWKGTEPPSTIKKNDKLYENIKDEVADIAIYLLYLCHDLDIDLESVILNKVHKNAEKYPINKYYGTI